jgi:hypothetical protein
MIMTEFLFVHKKQKVKVKLKNNSLSCQSCSHSQRNFNRVNVAENEMNAKQHNWAQDPLPLETLHWQSGLQRSTERMHVYMFKVIQQ